MIAAVEQLKQRGTLPPKLLSGVWRVPSATEVQNG